jgi:hypothetical protein
VQQPDSNSQNLETLPPLNTSEITDQVVEELETVGETISNRLHDIGKTAAEQQQNNLVEVFKAFIPNAKSIEVQYGYVQDKDQGQAPFTNIILDVDPIDLSRLAENQAMEINLGLPTDASLSASVNWLGMKSAVSKIVIKLPLSRASTDEMLKGRKDIPPMLQQALDAAFVEDTMSNLSAPIN